MGSWRILFLSLVSLWVQLFDPAQALDSRGFGLGLAADPAGVADGGKMLEQESIIDFAGARLVATRVVGELDVGSTWQVFLECLRSACASSLLSNA
jgi:hypothetical protein